MICPSCKMIHENVRGKCPHCGADFRGLFRPPRRVTPLRSTKVKPPMLPHHVPRLKEDEIWVRVCDECGDEWLVPATLGEMRFVN
jgi:hypothetical protein